MEHAPRIKVGDGVIRLPVKRLSAKELLKKLRPLDQEDEDEDDRQRPRPPSRADQSERGTKWRRNNPARPCSFGQGSKRTGAR